MYDAGSAALSVVPSLKGVEDSIRKQVTKWGAGWGTAAGKEFDKGFRESVGAGTKKAPAGPSPTQSKRQGQESGGAFADGFKRRLDQALKQLPKVTIGVARNEAEQQVKDLAARLQALSDKRVGVDIDAGTALAEAAEIQRRLDELGRSTPDVQVRADTAAASAQLAAVTAQVQRLSGQTATVDVDADTAGAVAGVSAVGAASALSITRLQALIGAGALLGPLIVPAAASAAAAVAAIGPAALVGAAGLGVAVLGFSGVAGAVQQMGTVQEQAAQSAATLAGRQASLASAADGVRSAEAALANTRASNADAARRAAQQVADAQRTLTAAERDALAVRRELSRAQLEARRALEDLASQVEGNAIDQEQANLDVAAAQAELDRVRADPKATEAQRRQAELTFERALFQVEELKRRGERLAADQKAANKAGVEGSEQVRAARERIASADERVAEAQRGLGEARRAADQQARQGAFALASAQQAVVASQRALAQASIQAGVGGTAAMQKLRQAMADLSPEGRRFSTFLFGLKDEFLGLRQAAERGLLPGVQAGIQALLPHLPKIEKFIEQIGSAMGGLAKSAGEALASPFWVEFFGWLGNSAGPIFEKFGKIFGSVLKGVASLMMAFEPVTNDLLDTFVDLAGGFADWAASFTKSQGFKDFIAYVTANAPLLGKLFVDLLTVGLKLLIGLAPLGEVLLKGLVRLFDWLAKLDPGVLLAIASAVAGIVVAIIALATGTVGAAIGAIVVSIVAMTGALIYAYKNWTGFRNVVDTVVKAVATAAIWLWNNVLKPTFTALADFFVNVLAPAAVWLWRNVLVPAFQGSSAAVSFAWNNIIKPVFAALSWFVMNVLGPVFSWLYNNVIKPVWAGIRLAISIAWTLIKVVFGLIQIYVRAVLAPLFTWLYEKIIKPVWNGIATAIKTAWNNIIKPVFNAVGGFIKDHVVPAFRTGVDAIGRLWKGLETLARKPVEFIVNTVLNKGIIGTFNKIASKFPGVDRIDEVKFARGGVLPGYTPGRDVHRFFGPGGMALDLSGGEAVLRPEATRALGSQWVDAVNAAARRGGATGVRRVLGYAGGGIIDGLGGVFVKARQSAGDVLSGAFDILTDPGGALRKLAAKLVKLLPGRGTAFGKLAAGMPTRVADVLADRLDAFLGTGPGRAVGRVGGDWPSGPGAQRGDSGVWRRIVAIIRATGPLSGSFGNAYRPGDPKWHGSGRALDWMGFNQDALAAHLARMRPLELIHRTNKRDYAYTRGRNVGSFNPALMEAHRNHIHVAMAGGGILGGPAGVYDSGGYLPPGVTTVINGTGRPEPVLTGTQFDALTGAASRRGGLDLRVVVDDGALPGLVRVEVDNQFGALADARVYNTV